MKKILVISLCMLTFACNAQVVVNKNQLMGRWKQLFPLDSYETCELIVKNERFSENYLEMMDPSVYEIETSVLSFPYYLSDTEPVEFDFSKVGKSTSGKYLVFYNEKLKETDYYTFNSFDEKSMMLYYKMKDKEIKVDAYDLRIYFVRMTDNQLSEVRLNEVSCLFDESNSTAQVNGFVESELDERKGRVKFPPTIKVLGKGYTITSMADSAFVDCPAVTSVTIPGSVQRPGMYVFRGCKNLTSATLQEGIPYVDTGMFVDCEKLTSVSIPESVTHIWSVAFSGCKSLASLTLPSKLAKIEGTVFRNCPSLKTITCLATTPPAMREDGMTFTGFDQSQCKLIVPKGCATKYRAATGWKEFKEIVEQTL